MVDGRWDIGKGKKEGRHLHCPLFGVCMCACEHWYCVGCMSLSLFPFFSSGAMSVCGCVWVILRSPPGRDRQAGRQARYQRKVPVPVPLGREWRGGGNAPGRLLSRPRPGTPLTLYPLADLSVRSRPDLTWHNKSLPIVKKAAWPSPIHSPPLSPSLSFSHTNPPYKPRPYNSNTSHKQVSTSILPCITTKHKSPTLFTASSHFPCPYGSAQLFLACFLRCSRLPELVQHRDKSCASSRGTFIGESAPLRACTLDHHLESTSSHRSSQTRAS